MPANHTRSYDRAVAYSDELAARVRSVLETDPALSERKMFGGLCFMLGGNMTCGIVGDELMVRVGPDDWDDALDQPGAREMDFTGRSMRGMVYVDAPTLRDDAVLERWVERGRAYASSLPPKSGAPRSRRGAR